MTDKAKNRLAYEASIKAAVLNRVRELHGKKDVCIAAEFVVDRFKRRADLVVVGSTLEVFEIKSKADSLSRLQGQVDSYLAFFEKVTLVVDTKHANKVLRATTTDVAVWEYEDGRLRVRRKGKTHKLKSISSLTTLLSVAELRKLVTRLGVAASSKRRAELLSHAEKFSAGEVRRVTLDLVREKLQPNTYEFWSVVGRRRVAPEHLYALSPILLKRRRYAKRHEETIGLWRQWGQQTFSSTDEPNSEAGTYSKGVDVFGSNPDSENLYELT